jgi:phosphatidylserine/phosphatidylglycerophosphate/cardiolipin synthase-like enzyme
MSAPARVALAVVCALALAVTAGCAARHDGWGAAVPDAGVSFDPDESAPDAAADAGGDAPGAASSAAPPTVAVTVEPDGTEVAQPLLTALESAEHAVHVEMYLLTSDVYVAALCRLAASGVEVKVLLNQSFPSGTSTEDTNARSFGSLAAGGVSVRWAPTNTGFDGYTHEKTVIIDPGTPAEQAWIMTMNLDYSALRDNREYLARDTAAADVAEAEAIFEADFADAPITPTGALVVAPSPANDAESALQALVESATTSIDVEAEELDEAGVEAPLFDALVARARSGVVVRVVLEESSDEEQAGAVRDLEAAGAEVIGYAYGDGSGLDIHAKAIVVDGARAYVGSENFSGGSLGYNRELGVIFDDPAAVDAVQAAIVDDIKGGSAYASD